MVVIVVIIVPHSSIPLTEARKKGAGIIAKVLP